MSESRILHARPKQQCFFKMIGEIRHPLSPGFEAAVKEACADDVLEDFLIDLRDATYIDSTNLGLIARIARCQAERGRNKPVIISTNHEVTVVLESMGFDQAFTIVDREPQSDAEFRTVLAVDADQRERARIILEAHKNLMDLDERNADVFRDVVAAFEKQIAAQA